MTPSIFSFTQKAGQAGAMTEPRPLADSGALPAPGAFAERLQQQLQAPPPPQAPRPAAPPEPASSSQEPAPHEPDAAARQARRGPAAQRPRASAPPPAEAASADRAAAQAKSSGSATAEDSPEGSAEAATPGARRGRSADASADTPPPLNVMLQWLAAKPQADAAATGDTVLPRGGAGDTALARAGKGLGPAGAGRLMPDDATGPAAGTLPAGSGEDWRAALDAEGMVAGHALAQDPPRAASSGTPAAAAWAPVAGAAGLPDAPTPVQVSLDTPVNRPEFRDELAAQVRSFAQDGIQAAVLNLNPAEMGPITVQIVLDGTQATVDFQALQPATRELIEASLPALASALHGEGLTLSGGSVGDQRSPSQGDAQARGGRGGDEGADAVASPPPRATARRTEGALDLYA
jgi:flagellar hook-length control protein FliK